MISFLQAKLFKQNSLEISMDLKWDDNRTRKFVTNVGLITSHGRYGPNIMSAEWTHHISYSPSLIVACIHPTDATADNIKETREFGVNLCAVDQNVFSSVAGGSTGKEVDKIAILKKLGFKFYKAKKIKPLMIKGAAMNAECKLLKAIPLGDHIMFVGEVVEISAIKKDPMIYHNGKYWRFGKRIAKSGEKKLKRIEELVKKFRKD